MSRFLCYDTETSGLQPSECAPVQIGVALMEDTGEVVDTFERIISPPKHWKTGRVSRTYDVYALKVSGLTLKQIEAGATCAEVCRDLRNWAANHLARDLPIVGWNVSFDFAFYRELCMLGGDWDPNTRGKWDVAKPPLVGPWHCAMQLAQDRLELPDYKLETAAKHFGLEQKEPHSAMDDSVLAGWLWLKLRDLSAP